ncbi:flagellar hook-associated protein FlgL [Enterobacter cloacae subsp. cloacae]|uniref:flagellar hook-associated protein FlgL n=1 Tax=Enterobacter cloacae TaxID=550 RepID=UPI001D0321E6|nr:flagellar hook-associated protein FlgL [Enterobacter cloacae]MCU6282237.1 flagellar hook-associated protein FlgL [Enterobacter cloacae]MCU6310107.1 flagellar hook-associated protein FlgL [Enterobacter cloacae]UDG03146.1 flagellar hook-associated protein FlgL [Enterobacter cloacae]WLD34564.1 flagellar hook-associated protein FlgL [Enterobacter cloacae subsp. cloacae]HEC5280894.1 flagellar hook-associated protein FlgL [Enterobacter cloacae]
MRLSTLYMYKNSAEAMTKRMSQSNDVYLRMSAGKTLLKASDDPAAATDAVKHQDALAKLEMYSNVRSRVRGALEYQDNILNGVGNLLTTTLKEKIVAAKSDTYSPEDRRALGEEIEGIRANLLDLANNRDASGNYIFSGFKTDTPAFDVDGNYDGGLEVRRQTVADGTEMQVSHLGRDIFDDIFTVLNDAVAALTADPDDADYDANLEAALSAAMTAVDEGINRLGKAQAELGTNLQQLDALDLSGNVMINDTIVKVQNAIGSDTSKLVTLASESQMSELAFNASMYVYKKMQSMNLFNMSSS